MPSQLLSKRRESIVTAGPVQLQGDGPWLIVIVALALPFLNGLLGEAGKDAWRSLKKLVVDLRQARGRGSDFGQIVIRPGIIDAGEADDSKALPGFPIPGNPEVEITIAPHIPDDAYRSLLELDLDAFDGGTLHWDEPAGEWRQLGGLSEQVND